VSSAREYESFSMGAGGVSAALEPRRCARAPLCSVLWPRTILRPVPRDTDRMRTISLIGRCYSK
jgi:hypothetical protein